MVKALADARLVFLSKIVFLMLKGLCLADERLVFLCLKACVFE